MHILSHVPCCILQVAGNQRRTLQIRGRTDTIQTVYGRFITFCVCNIYPLRDVAGLYGPGEPGKPCLAY